MTCPAHEPPPWECPPWSCMLSTCRLTLRPTVGGGWRWGQRGSLRQGGHASGASVGASLCEEASLQTTSCASRQLARIGRRQIKKINPGDKEEPAHHVQIFDGLACCARRLRSPHIHPHVHPRMIMLSHNGGGHRRAAHLLLERRNGQANKSSDVSGSERHSFRAKEHSRRPSVSWNAHPGLGSLDRLRPFCGAQHHPFLPERRAALAVLLPL